jgi:hypothetical protein
MTVLLFLVAMVFRALWENYPGILFCCAFWATMVLWNALLRQWLFFPGALSNAAATIANGGFMPSGGDNPHTGVYIALTADSNLPYLCDRFAGASIGDFLLLAAILVVVAKLVAGRMLKSRRAS